MTKSEALTVFNISEEYSFESLIERYEELIFEWKNELLRINFSVEILQIKLKKGLRIRDAFEALSNQKDNAQQEEMLDYSLNKSEFKTVKDFLQDYEKQSIQFKNDLSRTVEAAELIKLIQLFIFYQDSWERLWWKRFGFIVESQTELEGIKISEGTNLLELLSAANYVSTETKNNSLEEDRILIEKATNSALFSFYRETKRIQNALKRRTNL